MFMKIYTGGGDSGETSLRTGERVSKSHERIEAYGEVDELNSIIGALSASLSDSGCVQKSELDRIQSDLLLLGSWLATPPGSKQTKTLKSFEKDRFTLLENAIDRLQQLLPELKDFILPGGHMTSAWAHIARAVCRRVERRVVKLQENEREKSESCANALIYLNRLSDYFFVLGRWCNFQHSMTDTLWDK